MISFGITEDLQISGSLPITLESGFYMSKGRMMPLMSSERDFEGIVAWRFQRRDIGPGARLESTVFAGAAIPMQERRSDGMTATPSVHVSASSGYASRVHYFWVGGGYHHASDRNGDQPGDTVFYSVVYGYRPPALRLDYPKPDLRFFVEAVGEHTDRGKHHGLTLLTAAARRYSSGPRCCCCTRLTPWRAGCCFPSTRRRTFSRPNDSGSG